MKRFLFFNPYTPWIPHLMWEVTLAYALHQRGHAARFITCSELPDCGMAPARTHAPEMRCKLCRGFTEVELPKAFHRADFMQASLRPNERQEIAAWAAGLPVEELRTAVYDGLPLGEWAWPELMNCWHANAPDLTRPEVAQSYRDYLTGAAVTAACMPRIFAIHQPDVLVTLNGAFFLHRVALETAKMRGIRVITHERGLRDDSLTLNADAPVWDAARIERIWSDWKDCPLSAEELREVERLLAERRRGVNMGWWAYSPSPQDLQQVRAAANLPDKPLALLCTSSECEASLADRAPAVSQQRWVEATVDWFRAHPEVALVLRMHPHETQHAKVDDRNLRWYLALKENLPENCRLILPDEEVSTYTLMDIASVGLTYGTTAGLEMACQGTPVIHAGVGFYKNGGFTYEVEAETDIPRLLETAFAQPRSPEIQRLAYRFAYRYFFGLSAPFPKVKVQGDFINAELQYRNTAELAPGQDKHLDRIMGYLLGESELYPPPSPARFLLEAETETRFFRQQRVAHLLQAAARQPDRADLLIAAAELLHGMNLPNDAAAVYRAALQRDPHSPEAQAGLSRLAA